MTNKVERRPSPNPRCTMRQDVQHPLHTGSGRRLQIPGLYPPNPRNCQHTAPQFVQCPLRSNSETRPRILLVDAFVASVPNVASSDVSVVGSVDFGAGLLR